VKNLIFSVCLLLSVCALAENSIGPEDFALAVRGAQALKHRMRHPDSIEISKVVITTRFFKDGSDAEVCYQYQAKDAAKGSARHWFAVYSSSKGKEKLKLADEFLHGWGFECDFNSRVTRKMRAISTVITPLFNKQNLGESDLTSSAAQPDGK
jgi:hypothetical protein